jgi:hypothetical protein
MPDINPNIPQNVIPVANVGLMSPIQGITPQAPPPQPISPFPIGRGVSTNGDMDPYTFMSQQQELNSLYNSALTPQTPERSWTQGLARVLQSAFAGYKQAQLNNNMQTYKQNKSADMVTLANYLKNPQSGDFGSMVGGLHDPSTQNLAFNFMQGQQKLQQEMGMQTFKNNLDMQRDSAKLQTQSALDPTRQAQVNLGNINDSINGLQQQILKEQDPSTKKGYQDTLQQLLTKRDILDQQVKEGKGLSPDPLAASKAKAMDFMARGGKLEDLPADQAYALNPQAYNQGLSTSNTTADADIKAFKDAFKSSRDLHAQGQQVLQDLASNPDLTTGAGAETFTKARAVLNNVLPGVDKNLGSQEQFQEAVNNLLPSALGRLKAQGVQIRSPQIINNVAKALVPNMGTSKEGIQSILELQDVNHKQMEKANNNVSEIESYARTHPFFDKNAAFQGLQQHLDQDMQKASLVYANQKLAPQGKQLIINPQYDPEVGGTNQYMLAPLNPQPQPQATPEAQPTPDQQSQG